MSADFWTAWAVVAGIMSGVTLFGLFIATMVASIDGVSKAMRTFIVCMFIAALTSAATIPFLIELARRAKP